MSTQSQMNTIYESLRQGPLQVGEVRGFKTELAKRFDKSDKNAPPIIFGVLKVMLEQLGDGIPVVLTIYLQPGADAGTCGERLGLKKGVLISISVGKTEIKNGIRSITCGEDAVRVLGEAETALLREGDRQ